MASLFPSLSRNSGPISVPTYDCEQLFTKYLIYAKHLATYIDLPQNKQHLLKLKTILNYQQSPTFRRHVL